MTGDVARECRVDRGDRGEGDRELCELGCGDFELHPSSSVGLCTLAEVAFVPTSCFGCFPASRSMFLSDTSDRSEWGGFVDKVDLPDPNYDHISTVLRQNQYDNVRSSIY